MAGRSPLEIEVRRRIEAAGPMPVAEYMALCLFDREHGYYITRDPLGTRGDFITAPEVSQMFGELIGLWASAVWKQMGAPENVRLIELGPGRGTMMKDALRAVRIVPEFHSAIVVHLVEVSPVLQARQEATLEGCGVTVFWHTRLGEVPKGPAIIFANEFFDALPVNQAIKTDRGWHERRIQIDGNGQLAFTIAPEPLPFFQTLLPPHFSTARPGAIFEWRADTEAMEVGRRVADGRGAALVIDYGHTETGIGETFQAVGQHAYADPLSSPGELDLTAHVDFQALSRAVEAMGVKGFGPIEQSQFLRRLGIEQRAASLKTKAARPSDIDQALARLIGRERTAMGELFKVAAFVHPSIGTPPGFETSTG
ncbi:MAG TPA: SAM-dependent methyltransferase [Pseudolabrys sp.]|nr:SAM-dependent methyltransferase [Pseudolabrys sp.]